MAWLLLSSWLAFIPMLPVVNAATSPSIDGTTEVGTWTTGTSFTVTTVTASSGDVIIVFVVTYKSATSITVSSLPAVTGVTWQSAARESVVSCSGDTQETTETEWYGVTTAALSSATITVDLSATPTHASAYVVSIKGAAVNSPFDPNAASLVEGASACSATTADPTASSQTITNANDLVIQFTGGYTSVTETAGTIDSSTATLNKASSETDSSLSFQLLSVTAAFSGGSCVFGTKTTYWETFCDAVTANYASTVSPSLSLSATVAQGIAGTVSAALSLSSTLSKGTGDTESGAISLSDTLSQTAVAGTQSASLALTSAVSQAIDGISQQVSLALSPAISQAVGGVTQSLTLALSPVLSTVLSFFQTLSGSLSLNPSVGQLPGIAQALSLGLAPSFQEALAAAQSASLSLTPAVNQAIGGVAQSVTLALSPSVAAVQSFLQTVSASLTLAPSIGQGLSALTQSVSLTISPTVGSALFGALSSSVALVPGLDQDIAGVSQSVSLTLSPILTALQAFSETVSASITLVPSVGQGLAGVTQAASLTLSPSLTALQSIFETLSAGLSLSPSIDQDIGGITQSASLSLSPVVAAVLSFSEDLSASIALVPAVGQGLSGLTQSATVALSPSVSAVESLLETLSASLSLSPSLDQDLGGIAQSVSTSLTPSLSGVAAFLADLSASLSLSSTVDQDLAGITSSVTVGLSPVLAGAVSFLENLSASIALAPSVGQDIGGVANSVSVSLSPSLSSVESLVEMFSAAVSLAPSVDQDISGVTNSAELALTPSLTAISSFLAGLSASISLSPSLGQDIGGVANSVSIGLTPSLSSLAGFMATLSQAVSLSPGLDQDLGGVANSVALTLTPSVAEVSEFMATLTQSISLVPGVGQDLGSIAQSASVDLTPSLSAVSALMANLAATLSLVPSVGQDLAGLTSQVTVTLDPFLTAGTTFLAVLSSSISLVPTIDQDLAGITNPVSITLAPIVSAGSTMVAVLSASVSLLPTLDQGLGGITLQATTSLTSVLAGFITFVDAALGITTLSPSVGIGTGVGEEATLALSPLLITSAPTLASTITYLNCAPAYIAAGSSVTCTAEVAGLTPTGTVTFSSPSGSFTPSATCTLTASTCMIGFIAPSSAGSFTVTASYAGDSDNRPSSQTFKISVPSFSIAPSSGASGTPSSLSGTGFAPGGTYVYCFESGVTTVASALACSQAHELVATSIGALPSASSFVAQGQSGLVLLFDSSGNVVAEAQFAVIPPTTHASIVLSPASGETGTPVTVTGSGFVPGDTVTLTYTNGTITTSPATIVASPSGSFTASFPVPPSAPGSEANVVSALGSTPGDSASATFTATNVAAYESTFVSVPAGSSVSVNETASTHAFVQVSSQVAGSGSIVVSRFTNEPSYAVQLLTFNYVQYYDLFISGTMPGSASVTACFTEPFVNSGAALMLWTGSSWESIASAVTGTTICNTGTGTGQILASQLTGTNLAVTGSGAPPSGGGAPGPLFVSSSIRLTEETGGSPIEFSLSGCGVIPPEISGDGEPYHIAAYPGCTVTITSAAPQSDTTRYVFASLNDSTEMTTCSGLACSSTFNATYYQQELEHLSYSVIGSTSGAQAPTLSAFYFGSKYGITLTGVSAGYWVDANSPLTPPQVLPGSGSTVRWSIIPSSVGTLTGQVPNTAVLKYEQQYAVQVEVSPSGAGTTSFSGLNWFNASSTVAVSATPNAGYRFSHWSSATGITTIAQVALPTTSVTIDGPDTLTANFVATSTSVSSSTSSSTSTTIASTGVVSGSTSSSTSATNSSVTSVTATSTTTAVITSTSSTATSTTPVSPILPADLALIAALGAVAAVAFGVLLLRRKGKSDEKQGRDRKRY